MTLAVSLYVQITSEYHSIRLLLKKRLASIFIQDNISGMHQWALVQTNC